MDCTVITGFYNSHRKTYDYYSKYIKMRRISISGTHSVDKTTLTNSLIEVLKDSIDIKLIPEVARELHAEGFLLNQDFTEWGLVNGVTKCLSYGRNICADIILSDRSLIDILAYIKTNKSSKIRKKYLELVEEIVFEESKRFNYYFYLPIEFPLISDGIRALKMLIIKKK